MKLKSLLVSFGFITTVAATTGLALTVELPITPGTLRERPAEFGVKATKDQDGLIHFTIRRTLKVPMYLVAHLTVRHQGKLVVKSDTPSFAVKGHNTFYLSISPDDVAGSEFTLGESGMSKDGVPVVGTIIYMFRLKDFVPADLLRTGK